MSTPTLRLHRTDGSAKTFELAERANVLSSINEERNESDQQG